jgi:hypothetical protein
MVTIHIAKLAGTFAENKDIARSIRVDRLLPTLQQNKEVVLDFDTVTGATQSFIHALISNPIRKYGSEVLDLIIFKNCAPSIREIITTVTEYLQESQQEA